MACRSYLGKSIGEIQHHRRVTSKPLARREPEAMEQQDMQPTSTLLLDEQIILGG
jgi:hypothetical protein